MKSHHTAIRDYDENKTESSQLLTRAAYGNPPNNFNAKAESVWLKLFCDCLGIAVIMLSVLLKSLAPLLHHGPNCYFEKAACNGIFNK